jgi:hypothetical protein
MTLQTASELATIGAFLLALIAAFGGSILVVQYIRTMRPVWKRFAQNVGREVAVIATEKQAMGHEASTLKRVGYFKVKDVAADMRNLDLIRDSALIVVGYSPKSKIYKATLAYAKTNQIPIIVFSGKYRLSDDDRNKLKEYSFSSLCETELRLVSDVFAIISTFPNK